MANRSAIETGKRLVQSRGLAEDPEPDSGTLESVPAFDKERVEAAASVVWKGDRDRFLSKRGKAIVSAYRPRTKGVVVEITVQPLLSDTGDEYRA